MENVYRARKVEQDAKETPNRKRHAKVLQVSLISSFLKHHYDRNRSRDSVSYRFWAGPNAPRFIFF